MAFQGLPCRPPKPIVCEKAPEQQVTPPKPGWDSRAALPCAGCGRFGDPMSDDAMPLADLALPPRLRRLCAREGWHTVGELRDAVADGVVGRVRHAGPVTVALAEAVCTDPERWRGSMHENRAAR
jgi:hypothetical protein